MFSRTSSGIRNTHLFYSDSYLIIVEGESDQSFWSKFFPSDLNEFKRKFKPVGGKSEIKKYLDELCAGQGCFIVALDSDYGMLKNNCFTHERVVETYGHSIENLMFCSFNIASIICNLSHNPEYNQSNVDAWLDHFDEKAHSLMLVDFLVDRDNLGFQCIGDNCSRFFKNNTCFLDESKIASFVNEFAISGENIEAALEEIALIKPRFHIRGHFFFSAVLKFITHEVKRLKGSSGIMVISFSNQKSRLASAYGNFQSLQTHKLGA